MNKELAEGTKRLCVNIDRVVPLKTRYANLTVGWGTNQELKTQDHEIMLQRGFLTHQFEEGRKMGEN